MTTVEEQHELFNRIFGSAWNAVHEKLIEFKKQKHAELVVMRDDKIVRIKPEDLEIPPTSDRNASGKLLTD